VKGILMLIYHVSYGEIKVDLVLASII